VLVDDIIIGTPQGEEHLRRPPTTITGTAFHPPTDTDGRRRRRRTIHGVYTMPAARIVRLPHLQRESLLFRSPRLSSVCLTVPRQISETTQYMREISSPF